MDYRNDELKGGSPAALLFSFIMITVGCFLIFQVIGGIIMIATGALSMESLSELEDTQDPQMMKGIQLILSIGIFFIPVFLFALIYSYRPLKFLKLNLPPPGSLLLLTIFIVISGLAPMYLVHYINQSITFPGFLQGLENYLRDLEEQYGELIKSMLVMDGPLDLLINLLVIAVVPAVGEELLFRGGLQQLMQRWLKNPHVAIILTAAIFSFVHLQFFGFLPRMGLGIIFGYLFYWSGNLWLPILAHFLHNGIQVVLLYLYSKDYIETDIDQAEVFPLIPTLISLGFFAFFLVKYYKLASATKPDPGGNSELD